MSEYYGAPNDFRNYLEHRMDDYRWSSDKHKPRKGNDYNSNNTGKEQSAREKNLRNRFRIVSRWYTDGVKAWDNMHGYDNPLKPKWNIYEACLTILRNNNKLAESQMDYIQKFMDDVEKDSHFAVNIIGRR